MTVCNLYFTIQVNVDTELADDLGDDIAHSVLCEMFNGEDVIGVEYSGFEVMDK